MTMPDKHKEDVMKNEVKLAGSHKSGFVEINHHDKKLPCSKCKADPCLDCNFKAFKIFIIFFLRDNVYCVRACVQMSVFFPGGICWLVFLFVCFFLLFFNSFSLQLLATSLKNEFKRSFLEAI